MKADEIRAFLESVENEAVMLPKEYDDAVLHLVQHQSKYLVVYDREAVIRIAQAQHGVGYVDAREYLDFNAFDSAPEGGPLYTVDTTGH